MYMSERQHYWDNVKGVLIILVVVTHFMKRVDVSNAIYWGVYLFHMPFFIFVSGLFHNNQKIKERVLGLVIIGIVYNAVLILVDNLLLGSTQDFYLFRATKIPWFVLTIAMCTLVTYLLKDCNKIMVLVITTFLGCMACYDSTLMNYMSVAKLVSWYPFYYLGYISDPQKIENTIKEKRKYMLLGGILLAYVMITIIGRNCSISVPKAAFLYGGTAVYPTRSVLWIAAKLIYYIAVIVVSTSLLCVVPSKKIWGLTTIGERTMQIYFWHIIIRSLVDVTGIQKHICINPIGHIVWAIFSIAITGVLSLSLFGFPTSWIIRSIKRR